MTYISNPLGLFKPSLEAFQRGILMQLAIAGIVIGGLVGLIVVFAVVQFGVTAVGAPELLKIILNVMLFLAGMVAVMAMMLYVPWMSQKIWLDATRGIKPTLKSSLPPDLLSMVKLALTSTLVLLAILGGLLLLLIPGIIFAVWFLNAPLVTVDEGLWGPKALRRSRELARGRALEVWGAMMLLSAISIVMVVPVLGVFAYIIVSVILSPIQTVRYVQLVELKKSPDWQSLPVHWANYAVVVVGIIATLVVQVMSQPAKTGHKAPFEVEKSLF